MANSYRRPWRTELFLQLLRLHRRSYTVQCLGLDIEVMPGVLSPRYDWSGRFGAERLPDLTGKSFLDIGCGCGVVSVAASLRGAKRIVAADISPLAVENARRNLQRHARSEAEVVLSDVYDGIPGRFDVVFFAAPFRAAKAKDWLERALFDEDYSALKRFIRGLGEHLEPGGRGYLAFSSSGDLALLQREIAAAKLMVRETFSQRQRGYDCTYYVLTAGAFLGPINEVVPGRVTPCEEGVAVTL